MKSIKAYFKKYPIAYSCNKYLKNVQIEMLKRELKRHSSDRKDEVLPDYDQAYSLLISLRKEPDVKKTYGTMIIDEKVDLSIIVPIYNSEKYLAQCLDSIKNQTTHYAFQVICVDDGSTDDSSRIVDKYKEDSRFIIIHQENQGHSGARNTALQQKLGKYVMFIDSDDFICDDYIEKMLNAAYEQHADIVQGSFKKCNADSVTLETISCNEGRIKSYSELEMLGGAPWGRIYNTQLWDNVHYPEGMMFEDTIIFNIVFRRASYIYGIQDSFYMYRIYGENTLDKLQGDNRLLDAVWSVRYSLDEADRLKLIKNQDYYEFLLGQCSKHVYYRIKKMNDSVQRACFVVLCNVVDNYNKKKRLIGNENDEILRELENAFMDRDFSKWVKCSRILKLSCG